MVQTGSGWADGYVREKGACHAGPAPRRINACGAWRHTSPGAGNCGEVAGGCVPRGDTLGGASREGWGGGGQWGASRVWESSVAAHLYLTERGRGLLLGVRSRV